MNEESVSSADDASGVTDPRVTLASWANQNDEWLRYLTREIISAARPVPESGINHAHTLLRQEKLIDERTLDPEPELAVAASSDEAEEPLLITKLSNVQGVNALVTDSVIEPHSNLTILYGENGAGKTGYARVLKALANSRTADAVLGNIKNAGVVKQSATIDYRLGEETKTTQWNGEMGLAPFTRMAIFDSPAVNVHLDNDLEYVYTPAVLSLFNHLNSAIQLVHRRLDQDVADLKTAYPGLLARFPRESTIYPRIETLSSATDLEELKKLAAFDPEVNERLSVLKEAVAALEADTAGARLPTVQRLSTVLAECQSAVERIAGFDVVAYNQDVGKLGQLQGDRATLQQELLVAADLPDAPDDSWTAFLASGEAYRVHLEEQGVHDDSRCLYCRQTLSTEARELLGRYGGYLNDQLAVQVSEVEKALGARRQIVNSLLGAAISSFLADEEKQDERSPAFSLVQGVKALVDQMVVAVSTRLAIPADQFAAAPDVLDQVREMRERTDGDVGTLTEQRDNRAGALKDQKTQLADLTARIELATVWDQVAATVKNARTAAKIELLAKKLPDYRRQVTTLAKNASNQLINQSFDTLFAEECKHLRAPELNVQFVGREGKPQRRRTVGSNYKPSKVLSEGEQKVLAIADFLAEARLTGVTAPIVFDDPVSSLDHVRLSEVAARIAELTNNNQVIVFTHDILFATKLLSLFEKSKNCSYYAVTESDSGDKGQVALASGPRIDSLSNIKGRINKLIEAAKNSDGEVRQSLIRSAYSAIRSWCELFAEEELLQGVTRRYQPNVQMTTLPKIKFVAIQPAIEIVVRVFEEACRYTDAHSQPVITADVEPKLSGLEAHWAELQQCRSEFDKAKG